MLTPLLQAPNMSTAAQAAKLIADEMNQEFERRIFLHQRLFNHFWRNPDATPEEIAAALGNQSFRLLQLSRENIEHISRIAALQGTALTDYIPPTDFMPPKTITENTDGTITLS